MIFMELLIELDGVSSHIGLGHKSLWSCYMYSIDGIRRRYARRGRFGRPKMELGDVTYTHFSEIEMRVV